FMLPPLCSAVRLEDILDSWYRKLRHGDGKTAPGWLEHLSHKADQNLLNSQIWHLTTSSVTAARMEREISSVAFILVTHKHISRA
ncbi:hypothetical protein STEG23_018104, partial [Scotinomys teguina]